MFLYSVSFFERFYLIQDSLFFFRTRLSCFSSYKKHVLRSMFHLNKLHNLSLISEIFHYQCTYRICNHHSLTFHENAVTCYSINDLRLLHFLTDLLVTTWSTYYQLSIRLYTFYNSVVSGSIASMKSDEDI